MIQTMPAGFQPQNAQDDHAVIQYRLLGEGGGDWYITVDKGTCTTTEGVSEAADMTISGQAQDFVDLAMGKLDAITAVLGGRIQFSGNMALALKLQSWFKPA